VAIVRPLLACLRPPRLHIAGTRRHAVHAVRQEEHRAAAQMSPKTRAMASPSSAGSGVEEITRLIA
jgi:hypothetical protein